MLCIPGIMIEHFDWTISGDLDDIMSENHALANGNNFYARYTRHKVPVVKGLM
jgi:hypothetical protein